MMSLIELEETVAPGGEIQVSLSAACIEYHKAVPTTSVGFAVSQEPLKDDLRQVLSATSQVQGSLRQVAIWLVTDDMTLPEMQRFFRGLNGYSIAQRAIRLLADAGFDLNRFSAVRNDPRFRWDVTGELPPDIESNDPLARRTLYASLSSTPEMFDALMRLDLDAVRDEMEGMPIDVAVYPYDGVINVLQTLFDLGAVANEPLEGASPIKTLIPSVSLSRALRSDLAIEIIQLLLEHGIDVNHADRFGETPLHVAACDGDEQLVRFLLDNGGAQSIDQRGQQGKTPALELIDRTCREPIDGKLEALIEAGADVNVQVRRTGRTLLHRATAASRPSMVEILLRNGADPLIEDDEGETPFSIVRTRSSRARPSDIEVQGVYRDFGYDIDEDATDAIALQDNEQPYALVVKVPPLYPRRALERGLSGYVTVQFTIREDGGTRDVVAIESSSALFDRMAIMAVESYKYRPRRVNGVAVATPGVETTIEFSLE